MERLVYKVYVIFSVLLLISCEPQNVNDESHNDELVIKRFESYKTAILNLNGDKSSNYISKNSFKFYDEMIKNALYMDSANVKKLTITEKLYVIHIRASLNEQEARRMNGKQYFAYMINAGFFDQNAYLNKTIGQVLFKEKTANVSLLQEGKDSGVRLDYLYENNQWKLNIMSPKMIEFSNFALSSVAEKQGFSENDLIRNAIEFRLNIDLDNSIWRPLAQKK